MAPRKATLREAGDGRLAAMAAAGDHTAFEAIFERHHRGLLSLCRHLLGSPEEAEDALQHTFAVAYRELVEGRPPRHLRAWLYATARNRCMDMLRRRRELPAEVPAASTAGLSEEVERRSDLRDLVADIGRLPDDQRAALVMSEIEDLGHEEVATVLGCPRDKVRALVFQARSSLAGWREARALPCREVREELSVAHGGALRRGHLRRHLKICTECAAFREDVDRQRRGLALILPVPVAAGLAERVLEGAAGAGAAAGGAAAGSAGGSAAGGAAGGSAGGAAAGQAGGGAAAGSAGGGLLGPTAIKIGAAVLVLGGAGIATFGGLPGGSPDQRTPPDDPPAAQQQPASAERQQVAIRRERERRAQAKEKRARIRERRAAATPGDQVGSSASSAPGEPVSEEPVSGEPAPAEPAPAEPAPGEPQPAPQPAPAPQAEIPAGNRGAQPGAEVEVEAEVDPPDALP